MKITNLVFIAVFGFLVGINFMNTVRYLFAGDVFTASLIGAVTIITAVLTAWYVWITRQDIEHYILMADLDGRRATVEKLHGGDSGWEKWDERNARAGRLFPWSKIN